MEERKELEMHDFDECNDPNCEHNHENDAEFDSFTVTDEDGTEHHFNVIAEFENEGKLYWVVEEFFEDAEDISEEEDEDSSDEDEEEGYIVFRVEHGEDENPFLYSVEDEEFEEVSKAWSKLVEEILAEEDVEEE
jgi:uncharacterized protein YrzB (UPF0473 family)